MLSVNCQGLRTPSKQQDVLNYLSNLDPSIICLQDTHWLDTDVPLVKKVWNGDYIINGKKSNSRGVAILFKKTLNIKLSLFQKMRMVT